MSSDPTVNLDTKAQTISPGDDSGLLSRNAGGYAPREDETETRIRRVKTKHVVVFWIGTAAGLSVAVYAYHAAKYKFESRKIEGYLRNGTDFVYSIGYLMEKAHQTRTGTGVPDGPPRPSAMRAAPGRTAPTRPPEAPSAGHRPFNPSQGPARSPMPDVSFPIRGVDKASVPGFDVYKHGGNPDPTNTLNVP